MVLGKIFGGPKHEKENWIHCPMRDIRKGDYVKAEYSPNGSELKEEVGEVTEVGFDEEEGVNIKYIVVNSVKIPDSMLEFQRRA